MFGIGRGARNASAAVDYFVSFIIFSNVLENFSGLLFAYLAKVSINFLGLFPVFPFNSSLFLAWTSTANALRILSITGLFTLLFYLSNDGLPLLFEARPVFSPDWTESLRSAPLFLGPPFGFSVGDTASMLTLFILNSVIVLFDLKSSPRPLVLK